MRRQNVCHSAAHRSRNSERCASACDISAQPTNLEGVAALQIAVHGRGHRACEFFAERDVHTFCQADSYRFVHEISQKLAGLSVSENVTDWHAHSRRAA
jgi:hypothetical protein